MRQRNIKNIEEKLEANGRALVKDPKNQRGKWKELFGNQKPIYLEIGCGKGKFIASRAAENPGCNYIACEGQSNVVLRALEKAQEQETDNLRIFIDFVNDLGDYFEEGELAGIYLNFSDPWPKERHAKRRLTYRDRLRNYKKYLEPGGKVEFKTDNRGLFDFTVDEIREAGLEPAEMSEDLHGTGSLLEARKYTTEYEDKFRTLGKNIYYVKF